MTIKTPKIKYSDSGFLTKADEKVSVKLFNASIPILQIMINNKICINKICYNKLQFNSEFLGDVHYNNLLEEIMLFQPIYNKKNIKYEQNGFSQSLHVKGREIFYLVSDESATFRDTHNKILIKITLIRTES